jgi:tripartite ATP-independent transporter DctM subunit
MNELVLLMLFIGLLVFFFISGIPVAFGLGLTSLVLMLLGVGPGLNPDIIISRMFRGIDSFVLLCIPLFIMGARIMNEAGLTTRLFGFANQLVGRFKGGLAHVCVIANMIMAGMSGVATADAAGLGPIGHKAMKQAGYSDGFSLGLLGAAATIGPIIPPSLPLVIFAILAGVSAGKLLIAGILPGILIGLCLMAMVYVVARRRNFPMGERATWVSFRRSIREGGPALLTPLVLVGGIVSGIFTVTEAAGVATLYSLILGFLYRSFTWKMFWDLSRATMIDSATIMLIIATAQVYGFLAVTSGLPVILAEKLLGISRDPLVILMIINGILLIVGCFLETIASLTLLTPIFMPIVKQVGIDPVHFGIVMVFNLMIGLLTPPFGAVLFVLNKCTGVDLATIIRGVVPFYIPLVTALVIMTVFPSVSMFLVGLLFVR